MEVLLSREELSEGVDRLAALVQNDHGTQSLVLVGVLTGSIMLVADLLRRLNGSIEVGMVSASSYRGVETTPGKLDLQGAQWLHWLRRSILGVQLRSSHLFSCGRRVESRWL